jgi:hypothetical protein
LRATTTKIGYKNGTEPETGKAHIGLPVGFEPRRLRPAARGQAPELARALGRLLGRVQEDIPDPARAAQVAILRNAVSGGRYAPDLHAVARSLLIEIAAEPVG